MNISDAVRVGQDLGLQASYPKGLEEGSSVVVAMSGGVDSSVAAALLTNRGYNVIGVTLQLYDHGSATGRKRSCCAGQDIHDARRVAGMLNIPHYVLDYESRFREAVIDPFINTYQVGETPVPCAVCNQTVKFTDLFSIARDLGAQALVTGHYVRRIDGTAGPELHRARDRGRDQSYFLFGTTLEQLEYLQFPLGDFDKKVTRCLAEYFSLGVAEKPDSQDICFVPEGRYAEMIERLRPGAADPGEIVDLEGRIRGSHNGLIHFTIGQRRGLGISASERLYVLQLDRENNRVIVGPKESLGCSRFTVREVNWLKKMESGEISSRGLKVDLKVRSSCPGVPARIFKLDDGVEVILAKPELAVAPGQAAVFYVGERIVGGGWIAETRIAS